MPPRRPSGFLIGLGAIVAVAAFLRFEDLGGPSYWLDEILGQFLTGRALAQPWWRWLTGLEPEHGPLYYALQAAARLGGDGELAGRFPAALLGVLTVPLAGLAARRALRSERAGLAAAALLAVSPLHVYYSREARPYALLMFLAAAFLAAVLRDLPGQSGAGEPARHGLRAAPAILVLLLYSSAVAAPALLAGALSLAVIAFLGKRVGRLPHAVAMAALFAVPLLYRGVPQEAAGVAFPRMDAEFFARLLRNFTVSAVGDGAGGRTAAALGVLALAGAVALATRNRPACAVLVTMTVVPAAGALGGLAWTGHWYSVRYLAAALPAFLILAAAGIDALADLIARRPGRFRQPVAAIVTGLVTVAIVIQTWPAARNEPYRKLDWRGISREIWSHAKPGDLVLTAETWSEQSLRYYFERLPPRVRLRYMAGTGIAEIVLKESKRAWLVTAGSAPDEAVRNWMCRYPLLLASPIESFRLHYAPSRGDFLATRSGQHERRALAAAWATEPLAIPMRADHAMLLAAGWADAELAGTTSMRWVVGRRASVLLPRVRRDDARISMRVLPLSAPSLAPQTMQVLLNGRAVGEVVLDAAWGEYRFEAPAAAWNGEVNLLDLRFDRANAPASLGSGSTDARPLAAAFEWITVDGANPNADPSQPERGAIRLGADAGFEARTIWRGSSGGPEPASLKRASVEPLLARLGLDPSLVWPRLASGEVRLGDVVEILALDSACEDDQTFVRRSFTAMFGRAPRDDEEKGMLRDLRSGVSRVRLIGRLTKHREFLAKRAREAG